MAKIFKENKIKELVSRQLSADLMDKIQIVKCWHDDYHNGSLKTDKETSREQAFNHDFFVKILGYAEKPEKVYSLEPKATSDKGQLPDAIIGYFNLENEIKRISAVVELKGASVSLDKPQKREGNMSPIQQAFKYKSQYRACPFVLVSNFWEFRLFQDNQLDYEIWTLDDLVNPNDDYFQFKKFYYLLNKENFTTKEGQTNTEHLLSDIRVEQEEISKKFYAMYKDLRIELLRDIYHKNPEVRQNIEVGIEKAQKIIDRVVFICFSEDRGLLPDNTLPRTLAISQTSFGSLWNVLQGLFDAIDKGSEKLEIPDGYNGGLFKEDNVLNNLKISDEVLKKLARFGEYNFTEDLSVNILGHIFEQSITDLEEIKNKVQAANDLPITTFSKRKKDGIFYTPDFVVDYIIENSLGALLREKEQEFKNKHGLKDDIQDVNYEKRSLLVYTEYQSYLQNIKVLDPACGSGAFLVRVFDYLLKENERVGHILGGNLLSDGNFVKSILQNNIFGVDLNSESVEITKLSLWLKTAQKGKKLTTLDNNIKCGNSLIDDELLVGNKAFDWNKEFKDVMKNGGFDVVVGNPPYLRIQGLREHHHQEADYFDKNFVSATSNYDLYVLFIEKAWYLLNQTGRIGFITPHKWLIADFGSGIRKFLSDKAAVESIYSFGHELVFEGATTYTALTFLTKKANSWMTFFSVKPNQLGENLIGSKIQSETLSSEKWILSSEDTATILKKIQNSGEKLGTYCSQIYQGLISGRDEIFCVDELDIEPEILIPHLRGKDIFRYAELLPSESLVFPYERIDGKHALIPIEKMEVCYPKAFKYLKQFENELRQREGGRFDNDQWYQFSRNQALDSFLQEKILTPEISAFPSMTYDLRGYAHNSKVHGIVIKNGVPFDYYSLLSLLNSKVFWFFIKNTGNVLRGGYFGVKKSHISPFVIPTDFLTRSVELSAVCRDILKLAATKNHEVDNFTRILIAEFLIEKWPVALNEWWNLDFTEFCKALKSVKLSLSQKDDLLQLFNKYQSILSDLTKQIDKLEQQIDATVYSLYKLSPNEIETIEQTA